MMPSRIQLATAGQQILAPAMYNDLADEDWDLVVLATEHGVHAVIRGVTIDLTHPDLDWTQWAPAEPFATHFKLDGPKIWFPWFVLNSGAQPPDRVVKISSGDVVSVERVTRIERSSPWGDRDHPHNQVDLQVFLKVTCRDGESKHPEDALLFRGRGEIWRQIELHNWATVHIRLEARLSRALAMELSESILLSMTRELLAECAQSKPKSLGLALTALWEFYQQPDPELTMYSAGPAFGYLMGRIEGDLRLAELAHVGKETLNQRSEMRLAKVRKAVAERMQVRQSAAKFLLSQDRPVAVSDVVKAIQKDREYNAVKKQILDAFVKNSHGEYIPRLDAQDILNRDRRAAGKGPSASQSSSPDW